MKIGFSQDILVQKAGNYSYAYHLIKNLLKINNNENEYFCLATSLKKIHILKEKARNLPREFQNLNIKILKIPQRLFLYHNFLNKLIMSKVLKKVDIFHSLHFYVYPTPQKTKQVVTIHDLITFLYPQFHLDSLCKSEKIHAKYLKKVDKIIAVSNNTKKDIIEILKISPDKIKVIYLGVADEFRIIEDKRMLEFIRNKYNLNFPFILYVGTIEPRKNLINLIKAFSLMSNKLKDYRLIIVGSKGWLYDEIIQTYKESKAKSRILFLGYVPFEDLVVIYNLANLFVYISFYEGFGLPVLEAMACGCPVITSNTSSLPEIAGDATILINPYDVEEITEVLYKVLIDESLQMQIKEKGLNQAKKFSWEITARQTLEVYKEVAKE